MPRIAVDAMGADASPRVEVEGVVSAVRERGIDVVLVGDEARVRAELKSLGAEREKIQVLHAPEAITMHDAPSMAVKQKKKSSMRMCFDLVKAGEADAVVSAGNSGAMMACGLFVLGRLPGVERPAIVTTFPTKVGECALLDMGANVDPKPAVLAQFGVLGAVYARLLHGKERPKVGLLSNGSEEHKGTPLTREAHALLSRAASGDAAFTFVGYAEGRDIFRGDVDVVVTDGFTGNVAVKVTEGVADFIFRELRASLTSKQHYKLAAMVLRPALLKMRDRVDPGTYGGVPLIGVNGFVIIGHGNSNARAIKNALRTAHEGAQSGMLDAIRSALARQ
jgi:glycerol-3-phosphate acyltransferase PlsX